MFKKIFKLILEGLFLLQGDYDASKIVEGDKT